MSFLRTINIFAKTEKSEILILILILIFSNLQTTNHVEGSNNGAVKVLIDKQIDSKYFSSLAIINRLVRLLLIP